jgi:hypothetical protein
MVDQSYIVYQSPIAPSDLVRIQEMLQVKDVFVPSFDPGQRLYELRMYVEQRLRFGTNFTMLVDRNVATRWVGLLDGADATEQHRLAAAIMTFAQCAGIMVEPGIAYHELAWTTNNQEANSELFRFRVADNLHPACWADLALGRVNHLDGSDHDPPPIPNEGQQNLDRTLNRWVRNYIFALKVAELHLQGGPSEHRMVEVIRWMYDDFLIGGPALRFAAQCLAPSAPRRRLLKGIESPDREKAIAGVRNAAWDLTLLSEWLRQIEKQIGTGKSLVILCSLDAHVCQFARALANDRSEVDGNGINNLTGTFANLWGAETGRRLSEYSAERRRTAMNPSRQLHREVPPAFLDQLIARGEEIIRSWKPKAISPDSPS